MDFPNNLKKITLDILFPIHCLSCNRDDVWICDECQKNIPLLNIQKCPFCEKTITLDGKTCLNCKSASSLDALLVASEYDQVVLKKMIHFYKYKFVSDLQLPLGNLLLQAIFKSSLPIPDIIIPIPLHSRRLRWRGFNQSEMLASHVGKNLVPGLEIPIETTLLIRKKSTPPQMKIKRYAERFENIREAFSVATKNGNVFFSSALKDKNVLLIDDIATTGATLFACADLLKQRQAKKVFGLVLARQKISPA